MRDPAPPPEGRPALRRARPDSAARRLLETSTVQEGEVKAIALASLQSPRIPPSREWLGPPGLRAPESNYETRVERALAKRRVPTATTARELLDALRAAGVPPTPHPSRPEEGMLPMRLFTDWALLEGVDAPRRGRTPKPGLALDEAHRQARPVVVLRLPRAHEPVQEVLVVEEDGAYRRLPRCQVFASGDDPTRFAAWLADAYARRAAATALLRFELYVRSCPPSEPQLARARHPAILARVGSRRRWRRVPSAFVQAQFAEAAAAYEEASNRVMLDSSRGVVEADARQRHFVLPQPAALTSSWSSCRWSRSPSPSPSPAPAPAPAPTRLLLADPHAQAAVAAVLEFCADFRARDSAVVGFPAAGGPEAFLKATERSVSRFHHGTVDAVRVLTLRLRGLLDAGEWGEWRSLTEYQAYDRTPLKRLAMLLQAILSSTVGEAGLAAMRQFVAAPRCLRLTAGELPPAQEVLDAVLAAFDCQWETFCRIQRPEPLLLKSLFMPRTCVGVPAAVQADVAALRAQLEASVRGSLAACARHCETEYGAYGRQERPEPAVGEELAGARALLAEREASDQRIPFEDASVAGWLLDLRPLRAEALERMRATAHEWVARVTARLRGAAGELSVLFASVDARLQTYPKNLDHLAAIERETVVEVERELGAAVARLQRCAGLYRAVAATGFRVSEAEHVALWASFESANTALRDLAQLQAQLLREKERFGDAAAAEQRIFQQALVQLQRSADELVVQARTATLGDEERICARLSEIEHAVGGVERQVQSLNVHERLIGRTPTAVTGIEHIYGLLRPYKLLWGNVVLFYRRHRQWISTRLDELVADEVAAELDGILGGFLEASYTIERSIPLGVVQTQASELRQQVPLLAAVTSPHMLERHWDALSQRIGSSVHPRPEMQWRTVFELGLPKHEGLILQAADVAATEHSCEALLEDVEARWGAPGPGHLLQLRDVDSFVAGSGHAALREAHTQELLAEATRDRDALGKMRAASGPDRHRHHFAQRAEAAFLRFTSVAAVLELWLAVQAVWVRLHKQFAAQEVDAPIPAVTRFARVEQAWRRLAEAADGRPAHVFCDSTQILHQLQGLQRELEGVESVVFPLALV